MVTWLHLLNNPKWKEHLNWVNLWPLYLLVRIKTNVTFQDFTLDFYFRQFWTDPRLAYKKRPGVETLSVGSEFIRNIWVPDTFFVNEKQSYFHIATTSNEFIRIHHSGSITRSIRWVTKNICICFIVKCKFWLVTIILINFKFYKNYEIQ